MYGGRSIYLPVYLSIFYLITCINTNTITFKLRRKIVLVAIQDDGSRFIKPALKYLYRIGAKKYHPSFKGSFAGVFSTSVRKPRWIRQDQQPSGPSKVRVTIRVRGTKKGRKFFNAEVLSVTCRCVNNYVMNDGLWYAHDLCYFSQQK